MFNENKGNNKADNIKGHNKIKINIKIISGKINNKASK